MCAALCVGGCISAVCMCRCLSKLIEFCTQVANAAAAATAPDGVGGVAVAVADGVLQLQLQLLSLALVPHSSIDKTFVKF